ncbi:MAG: GTPase Era [Bacteroidetes bacterium]|nr:MAG: GTPase Era [Bacteroidota bacterium]
MTHKAGFISIIGKPNVGKSTLMNALIGEKLSIITPKAQTTRHSIMGIINTDDYQVVFNDTPGIIDPQYGLQKSMMRFVDESLEGADVVLYIAEVGEKEIPAEALQRLQKTASPVVLALNKIDTLGQEEIVQKTEYWKGLFGFSSIVPISALNKFNTQALLEELVRYLPVCPPYYPKDQLTDKPEKFFAAEILREKIFFRYKKEIPYSTEVVIEQFKDEPELLRISAVIMVERDSQKGILIGEKGLALKNTGTAARKEMENFFGKKVFLEMFVKVKEKWRDTKSALKEFGYDD